MYVHMYVCLYNFGLSLSYRVFVVLYIKWQVKLHLIFLTVLQICYKARNKLFSPNRNQFYRIRPLN